MKTLFSHTLIGFSAALLVTACGPKGSGPSIPSSLPLSEATPPGTDDSTNNGTSDANPVLDTSSPLDATVAHRLLALPTSVQDKVKACEAAGTFYDLGDQLCTTLAPAAFPCIINDEFKTRLDPTTIAPLDEYLATKAVGHRLYGCTEEGANITLHFYKYENDVVNYKKLNIAKKAN